jgi:hypothetical protein
MKPRIRLVNPPIYDFSAYDFCLTPKAAARRGVVRGIYSVF